MVAGRCQQIGALTVIAATLATGSPGVAQSAASVPSTAPTSAATWTADPAPGGAAPDTPESSAVPPGPAPSLRATPPVGATPPTSAPSTSASTIDSTDTLAAGSTTGQITPDHPASTASATPDASSTEPLPDPGPGEPTGVIPTPPANTTAIAPANAPLNAGANTIQLPSGSAQFDTATLQRLIARLVETHALGTAADALDPGQLAGAIRTFQHNANLAETGVLDGDTAGRLLAP